jgi:hypothetical protein
MSNTPAPVIANHPPLAHDAQGCKLAVPESTTHWRILRHTSGRPKIVLGPDMQPGRFNLELTAEQLLELCGPGKYRVEALDQFGKPIACVTTLVLGMALDDAPVSGELVANTNMRSASDTRVMLETIAQMSRAHSESLQSLASAQADWIKTLATSKQLPRNAAPVAAPVLEISTENHEPEPWWVQALKPSMPVIVQSVLRNLGAFIGIKPDESESPKRRNVALPHLGNVRPRLPSAEPPVRTEPPATSVQEAFERAFGQIHTTDVKKNEEPQ